MKKIALIAVIAIQSMTFAQIDSTEIKRSKALNEVIIKSARVGDDAPVAHENVSSEDIEKLNLGVDLPVLLDQQTSVVTTTDAGAGVGYTGLRIRGSDGARINVTVNGIPINDSESQGVFWVNMPDLASSTNSIQIQRGVGSSTNGAGAFGASINVNTLSTNPKPYAVLSNSFGSFNTLRNSLQFGTGTINKKFAFDGRVSNIVSDGYIDRASSNLQSYYLSGTYYGKKSMLKAVTFAGREKTYQAWNGVPTVALDTNRRYNPYDYENEVDNYRQSHYQLHYVYHHSKELKINAALHYTRGLGYFEQYKGISQNAALNGFSKESLSDYGLQDIITPGGDTITDTDLIRRRWLDNHFYGAVFSAEYTQDKLNFILGGGANQYLGDHYGEVIWAEFASNGAKGHQYYQNDAYKNDLNIYAKADYALTKKLTVFGDLQVRSIGYSFLGFDNDLNNIDQSVNLIFFNPKAGVNYKINGKQSVYGFFGVGNKEPNRNDYTNSTPNSRPLHETLFDIEAGYRFRFNRFYGNVNIYAMEYQNQLIVTGELNDVGAAIRQNVENSFRRGIELTTGIALHERLNWNLNATYSINQIAVFNEFIDDWDTGGQVEVLHENTQIALSPSIIAGSQISYTPLKSDKYGELEIAFITKYVGEQFIDNTESEFAKLDDYLVNDLRLQYALKSNFCKEIVISGWVRNIFNEQYISNAWVYRFQSSGGSYGDLYEVSEGENTNRYNLTGLFPQAGVNFFAGVTFKF